MEKPRRQFIKDFASVGAVGAATMAMAQMGCAQQTGGDGADDSAGAAQDSGGAQASRFGKGPALEGPYIDLRTGRGNQLAYARIQSDIDFGKQKYFWFKGYVSAIQPMTKIRDLFGAQGFGVIRLNEREDGSFERLCREIILYTDLRTGEVMQTWDNPLTDETVDVVQVANDPFNYLIEEYFPAPPTFGGLSKEEAPPRVPFVLPWHQHGDWLEMETHIHLLYPSALQPDEWPRESSGPMVQVSEFFAHHVKADDMQNPEITSLDYRGVWNRITPWLPWMLMGQTPGHIQYSCFMGTCEDVGEILDAPAVAYAEKNYAKYFDAPTEWSDESLSSLENYAREQTPAPPKS